MRNAARFLGSLAVALGLAGCAGMRRAPADLAETPCQFVVYNQTPLPLEIRLFVRPLTAAPIGALNPGELLTHSVPCIQEFVRVAGLEIPWQVSAPPRFGVLYGEAELVEGERALVALHWP